MQAAAVKGLRPRFFARFFAPPNYSPRRNHHQQKPRGQKAAGRGSGESYRSGPWICLKQLLEVCEGRKINKAIGYIRESPSERIVWIIPVPAMGIASPPRVLMVTVVGLFVRFS